MLLTPWCTSAPVTTTLDVFHVTTACVLDQFMFVTKSLQLHIGRGNYQQLKADKPCEHVHHRVTQGLIFTQSETAEIRFTFCIETTNPGIQVSCIHTSDWIHCYSELSAPTWWCHQMETFSALLALCEGNSPVTGEFPSQRPVTQSSHIFFDLRLNKQLSKQSWVWWFEMPSHSLWRHCNEWMASRARIAIWQKSGLWNSLIVSGAPSGDLDMT